MNLIKILLSAAALYLFATLLLYIFQRRFLYYPTPKVTTGLDTIIIKSSDEKLEVFVINPGKESAVIYFGGNAESVGESAFLVERTILNRTLYLVNYRGYGGSTGSPSEKGLYEDALNIYDYVKKDHGKISVFGRSLGTSVATYLAVNREIEKVILVTPFDSIKNIAKKSFPIFPISLLIKDSHDSIKRADNIKVPVLALIASNDIVVPYRNSKALTESLNKERLKKVVIEGADHSTISLYDEYIENIIDFLK